MRTFGRLFIALFSLMSAWPEPAAGQSSASREGYRERYEVLSERNIFLRERRRRREERPQSRPYSPPRPVEESYALRGVVFEEGLFRAYIENLRSGEMLRVQVGDALLRGVVSEIQMDAIEYDQGGRRTWIEIGQTLTGSQAVASGSFGSGSSAGDSSSSASQPSSPLPDANDPNLTIEQRMRLRRQQQLNQR
ncbi:MAG: hypothetical protein HRF43_13155 [Phycisphaerae bacterium]|jgi:hypothetical protein